MTAQVWYYVINNEQQPPVTFAQLQHFAAEGMLAPTDLVWTNGMAQWTEAAKVKNLFANTPQPQPNPDRGSLHGRTQKARIPLSEEAVLAGPAPESPARPPKTRGPRTDRSDDPEERPRTRRRLPHQRRPAPKKKNNTGAMVIAGIVGAVVFSLLLSVVILLITLTHREEQDPVVVNNPPEIFNPGPGAPPERRVVGPFDIKGDTFTGSLPPDQSVEHAIKLEAGKHYLITIEGLDHRFGLDANIDDPDQNPVSPDRRSHRSSVSLSFCCIQSGTHKLWVWTNHGGPMPRRNLQYRIQIHTVAPQKSTVTKGRLSVAGKLTPTETAGLYRIQLEQGQRYAIQMKSTNLHPILELRVSDGKKLLKQEASGYPRVASILHTPTKTKEYLILARDKNFGTGDYGLTVLQELIQTIPLKNNRGIVKDKLTQNELKDYQTTLQANTKYVIEVSASQQLRARFEWDRASTFVKPFPPRPLPWDAKSFVIVTPSKTAKYRFRVGGQQSQKGPFTFSIEAYEKKPLAWNKNNVAEVKDVLVKGNTLTYELEMEEGFWYTLDMMSNHIDSYLEMTAIDNADKTRYSDENSGQDHNARILFMPPKTGKYQIVAKDRRRRETAPFHLRVQKGGIPKLTLDESGKTEVKGQLVERNHKAYIAHMVKGLRYHFDMMSDEMDSFLEVRSPSARLIHYDDNSGGEKNARFTFQPPETGQYLIMATNRQAVRTGKFTLRMARETIPTIVLKKGQGEVKGTYEPRSSQAYVVNLKSGERYDLSFQNLKGRSLTLTMALEKEPGTSLAQHSTRFSTRVPTHFGFIPKKTAPYIVRLGSFDGGTFNLRIARNVPKALAFAKDATSLNTTGIYKDRPEHFYSIRLEKDSLYTIDVKGEFWNEATLIPPTGVDFKGVRPRRHREGITMSLLPPKTGDYQIHVKNRRPRPGETYVLTVDKEELEKLTFQEDKAKTSFTLNATETKSLLIQLDSTKRYALLVGHQPNHNATIEIYTASDLQRRIHQLQTGFTRIPPSYLPLRPTLTATHLIRLQSARGGTYALKVSAHPVQQITLDKSSKGLVKSDFKSTPEQTYRVRLQKDTWYDIALKCPGTRTEVRLSSTDGKTRMNGSNNGVTGIARIVFAPKKTDDYEITAANSSRQLQGTFALQIAKKTIPTLSFKNGLAKVKAKLEKKTPRIYFLDVKANQAYELSAAGLGFAKHNLNVVIADAAQPDRMVYQATFRHQPGRRNNPLRFAPRTSTKYAITVKSIFDGAFQMTIKKGVKPR